jgi:hypothetical protein
MARFSLIYFSPKESTKLSHTSLDRYLPKYHTTLSIISPNNKHNEDVLRAPIGRVRPRAREDGAYQGANNRYDR